MLNKKDIHEFTDGDWEGLAGAIGWEGDRKPLMLEGRVNGMDVQVIAGAEGISVFYEGNGGECVEETLIGVNKILSQKFGYALLETICEFSDDEDFMKMFQPLG